MQKVLYIYLTWQIRRQFPNYPPVFHTSYFRKHVTQRQISDIKEVRFNVLDI